MGFSVSKESTLSAFSVTSSVIGFISFAFTVATFLRIIWGNLETLMHANEEIPDLMGNLKQALYEERNHLRTVRRRCKGQFDEGAFIILYNAVKDMLAEFKRLEQPFVTLPHEKSQHVGIQGGSMDDYHNTDYQALNLVDRLIWLRTRGKMIGLSQQLGRLQTRRIARQTTDSAIDIRYVARVVPDMEDRLAAIELRLARGQGARRGD